MRNIFTYLSITLLCLGTSIVFSDHNEYSNNGGHSAWARSYNSNTYAGKKYTDKYYQNASDSGGHLSADSSTETTRVSTPGLLHCYASWDAEQNIRCSHYFWKGYYWINASIMVDGEVKDEDHGNWNSGDDQPQFNGVYSDSADAYYFENDTGLNASYPHPSILASDCSASGSIYGRPADMTWDAFSEAYSHIPW